MESQDDTIEQQGSTILDDVEAGNVITHQPVLPASDSPVAGDEKSARSIKSSRTSGESVPSKLADCI